MFDLFDALGWGYGDWQLELLSWLGVCLSLQMIFGRVRTALVPAVLWVSYLSIVNLQAPFTFSYGWEWLTCEIGFLVIFLSPLCARGLASWTPPPQLVLLLFRWCAFRLLLGAGMSKVGRNSSKCWRELTCTTTHYYTQPIPNMLSWYFHHLPIDVHRIEVALTFVEQLVLPFLMLAPVRCLRLFAAIAEMGFQFMIVATGNYAWINFIGALPCLSMLDDSFLSSCMFWCSQSAQEAVRQAAKASEPSRMPVRWRLPMGMYRAVRAIAHIALFGVMVRKSVDPLKELFGPAPWINNYDDWFLMNSQGVFGFINQHRVQVVLKYTHERLPSDGAALDAVKWHYLDFKRIPGDPERFPHLMSPYHYRLDWETWIRITARMENPLKRNAPAQLYHSNMPEFLRVLIDKILNGDDDAAGLMGTPRRELFKDGRPPTAISVDFASYTFTKDPTDRAWWRVEPVEPGASPHIHVRQAEIAVRKSPLERHWILASCVLCLVACFEATIGAMKPQQHKIVVFARMIAAAVTAHLFALVLFSDYPKAWDASRNYAPWLSHLPECSQSQRNNVECCYKYAHYVGVICSTIGGLMFLEFWRQRRAFGAVAKAFFRWDVVTCLALGAIGRFAYSASS